MTADPWPSVTAAAERHLATFGPPQPASTPDPDTWIARLGELPKLAQPGERWLYQSGSQVLGVLAARAAGTPFGDVVTDPPEGQWSQPPAFPDGSGGLVSSVDDMVAFGRMLLRGGSPVLNSTTVAEMTRDQLTPQLRGNVWPGFSLLGDRGWGYGVSVLDDGRYTWEGGFGTVWSNVPLQDLIVVVLTQRSADETGMPAACDDVLAAARGTR